MTDIFEDDPNLIFAPSDRRSYNDPMPDVDIELEKPRTRLSIVKGTNRGALAVMAAIAFGVIYSDPDAKSELVAQSQSKIVEPAHNAMVQFFLRHPNI